MIYLRMIPKELLVLANPARSQTFHIYKIAKIIMIGKNEEFVFATF